MKRTRKVGTLPNMKGLPKTHKKEIGNRQMVKRRGILLENLEVEMTKEYKTIENR